MRRHRLDSRWHSLGLSLGLGACLTACATTPEDDPQSRRVALAADSGAAETTSADEASTAETMAADGADAAEAMSAKPQRSQRKAAARVDRESQDFWSDPSVRRRFLETYLPDTETEPRLDLEEREDYQEITRFIADGNITEAMDRLEDVRDRRTYSAAFDFLLGNLLLEAERFEDAEAAYQAAIDKHAKFRRAWVGYAETYLRRNDLVRARPALIRLVQFGNADGFTYGMLGDAHVAAGDDVSAEFAFGMASMLEPQREAWRVKLAQTFGNQGRYAESVASFDALLKENPGEVRYWLAQAEAYIRLDQAKEAAENLEFVHALGQADANILNTLGDIYTNEGLFDVAVDRYLEAHREDPIKGQARALRSASQVWQFGAGEMVLPLVASIEETGREHLDPQQLEELLNLQLRIASSQNLDDKAADFLRQLIEQEPLDGSAMIQLAQYHRKKKEYDLALVQLERASSIDEFRPRALQAQVYVLMEAERKAEALPLLEQLDQIKPSPSVKKLLEDVRSSLR